MKRIYLPLFVILLSCTTGVARMQTLDDFMRSRLPYQQPKVPQPQQSSDNRDSESVPFGIEGYCAAPIIIDVKNNGLDLTGISGGVTFDLNSDGVAEHIAWTSAEGDDAWLTLDRDGNGAINNGAELFSNFTPEPPSTEATGFLALAEYDKAEHGGNGDRAIDRSDAIFSSLRLWRDTNHNGISEKVELQTLPELGVAKLDLNYKESKIVDQHGNKFKHRAKVITARDVPVGLWAWAVCLETGATIALEVLFTDQQVKPNEMIQLRFKIKDPATKREIAGLTDVAVLAFLPRGVWSQRQFAKEVEPGIYEIRQAFPREGNYKIMIGVSSLGASSSDLPFTTVKVLSVAKLK